MLRFKKSRGFTLIEIIVALMIFAILAVLAHQGLAAVLDYNARSRANYSEQTDLHRASAILLQDISHLRPRVIRDRLGGQLRPYSTEDSDYEVVFTRGGLPSIAGSSLGGLQRVAYSVSEDKELIRWSWPTLDSFVEEEPRSQVLMREVNRITFEQLNVSNVYEENWPPLNSNIGLAELPRMIRVELELENGLTIERLYPGLETAPQVARQGQPGNSGQGNNGQGDSEQEEEG